MIDPASMPSTPETPPHVAQAAHDAATFAAFSTAQLLSELLRRTLKSPGQSARAAHRVDGWGSMAAKKTDDRHMVDQFLAECTFADGRWTRTVPALSAFKHWATIQGFDAGVSARWFSKQLAERQILRRKRSGTAYFPFTLRPFPTLAENMTQAIFNHYASWQKTGPNGWITVAAAECNMAFVIFGVGQRWRPSLSPDFAAEVS